MLQKILTFSGQSHFLNLLLSRSGDFAEFSDSNVGFFLGENAVKLPGYTSELYLVTHHNHSNHEPTTYLITYTEYFKSNETEIHPQNTNLVGSLSHSFYIRKIPREGNLLTYTSIVWRFFANVIVDFFTPTVSFCISPLRQWKHFEIIMMMLALSKNALDNHDSFENVTFITGHCISKLSCMTITLIVSSSKNANINISNTRWHLQLAKRDSWSSFIQTQMYSNFAECS